MRFEDLIDLEARVALDERADADALRARDRAALRDLPAPAAGRAALLAQWLQALRAAGEPSLGERVATGIRVLRVALVVIGLLIGWSTAALLLRYDGGDPINVATWLLVVVFAQIALLVLLLVTAPLLRAFPDAPLLSEMHVLLRFLARLVERLVEKADDRLDPARREAFRAARHRLRARASLYRGVEQWVLLDLTQSFALAFNVGVVLSGLRLVTFSDLAFAWSTTLQISALEFHGWLDLLARPFAAIVPHAAPTLELVEGTRYWRGDAGAAARASEVWLDPRVAARWWTFLLAATVTYGLLPRVLLLAFVRVQRRRALRDVPLDTPEIDRIVRRLGAPLVETRGAGTGTVPAPASGDLGSRADVRSREPLSVVLWKDLPLEPDAVSRVVTATFGTPVLGLRRAGGLDYGADRALGQAMAAEGGRILVLAEGFEAPDKAMRAFLADLRGALGPRRTILVALVATARDGALRAAAADDVALWRDRLRLLDDPYLAVEPLEAT